MMPPRASTSRTRCPLAIPPTAGLQDIWAIRSAFRVNRAVLRPMRAAAMAASQPAWPAPTTTTSNCSLYGGTLDILQDFEKAFLSIAALSSSPLARQAIQEDPLLNAPNSFSPGDSLGETGPRAET